MNKAKKELIHLKDGAIYDIDCDDESYGGCETCDYGSRYINEITVELSKCTLYVTATKMYDHAVTEGWLIGIFLRNISEIEQKTEQEFIDWFVNEIKKICPDENCYGRRVYGVDVKIESIE